MPRKADPAWPGDGDLVEVVDVFVLTCVACEHVRRLGIEDGVPRPVQAAELDGCCPACGFAYRNQRGEFLRGVFRAERWTRPVEARVADG